MVDLKDFYGILPVEDLSWKALVGGVSISQRQSSMTRFLYPRLSSCKNEKIAPSIRLEVLNAGFRHKLPSYLRQGIVLRPSRSSTTLTRAVPSYYTWALDTVSPLKRAQLKKPGICRVPPALGCERLHLATLSVTPPWSGCAHQISTVILSYRCIPVRIIIPCLNNSAEKIIEWH